MAVTATPAFTQSILYHTVQIATANLFRDGTGTLVNGPAGGANGSLIDYIVFKAASTTVAGTLRIFVDDGANKRLIDEVATVGVTASGTVPSEKQIWIPPGGIPYPLPSGTTIKYCTNNSENWNALAVGSNF